MSNCYTSLYNAAGKNATRGVVKHLLSQDKTHRYVTKCIAELRTHIKTLQQEQEAIKIEIK